ncbi:cytochrome-c peroxidase [Colwellia hornerae]|uniref:C-type cytochrome n=1 Tax=Colwellia hornerae TaxID=89402 RepID=A0A5C6Q379_9GAMM|nr:cytochrome c peroxidase [Colwellia hornerae]TWX47188.1 c-type cytochrome [Colwellia hornerae]TWX54490.1 c-type cytochrome [Colwellia hornerae]TWX63270.1 c-type cytochrome [Colwellia hornerae]
MKSAKVVGVLIPIFIASTIYYINNKKPATHLVEFTAPFVFGRFTVPQNNPLTQESVLLGRRLFYDPLLSSNNQVSCATCHKQPLAFTDGLKTSVGVSGKPLAFNSMSLVNLMWGPKHFFWNGRSPSLEDQAIQPIEHLDEMSRNIEDLLVDLNNDDTYRDLFKRAFGEVSAQGIAKALANFQRMLISSNSRYDQYIRGELTLSSIEEQGRKLFMAHPDTKVILRGGNCIDCHSQFLTGGFSTMFDGFSNNGLDDDQALQAGLFTLTNNEAHRGLFKAPTLRNIAVTAPYMHDGRFTTLEDVLAHYNGGIKRSKTLSPLIIEADNIPKTQKNHISLNLNDDEIIAIIAFLHTLTDKEFLTNPAFSNPFTEENNNG